MRKGGASGAGRLSIALIASVAVLATAPSSGAAPSPIKILSPRGESLVEGQSIVVRVRVSGPGELTGFTRNPRNRDITGRFEPVGAGVSRARLDSSFLQRGLNHVFVKLRDGDAVYTDEVHFTVGKERAGALRLRGLGRRESGTVTVSAITERVEEVRAKLNGRAVGREFLPSGDGDYEASLAGHHGLRYRQNRLRVTALDPETGRFGRVTRRFEMSRRKPIVGAGPDQRGPRGTAIRLDGTSTRTAPGARDPDLRWEIVDRPAGADAKLLGAGTARPRLVAMDPGRYSVSLRASQPDDGRRVGSSQATGAEPTKAGSVTDTVEACAQPDVLPSGIPIETIVSGASPRVTVGDDPPYPMEEGGWAQLVVLDRHCLGPAQLVKTYFGGPQAGQELAADLDTLDDDQLVIVSGGGGGAVPFNDINVVTALKSIGAIFGSSDDRAVFSGDFSVVGIPGLPEGTADQLFGQPQTGSSPPGGMSGFLQLDTEDNYAFTWPPRELTFDTQTDASSDNQNVMSISTSSDPVESLPVPIGAGFHLVWLDALTGQVRGNRTFLVDVTGAADLANQLKNLLDSDERDLILVQSIGEPDAANADEESWAEAAAAIERFGANRYAFAGLDGTGEYSFVGAEGRPELHGLNSGEELVQVLTGASSARQTGTLQPDDQGTLTPSSSMTPKESDSDLTAALDSLLSQPDEPFDYDFSSTGLDPDAIGDAQELLVSNLCDPDAQPPQAVCGGLELGGVLDETFGIRAHYWGKEDDAIDWGDKLTSLGQLERSRTVGCDSACWTAVRTLRGDFVESGDKFRGLEQEFQLLDVVKPYFMTSEEGTLAYALQGAGEPTDVYFTAVSQQILALYDPPEGSAPGGVDAQKILDDVLTLDSTLEGMVPVVGGPISSAIRLPVAINQLVSDLSTNSGGTPAYDPIAFQSSFANWGTTLADVYTDGLAAFGRAVDLLTSDQGRLFEAAARVSPGGKWVLSDAEAANLPISIANSAAHYMWETMLPVPAVGVLCDPTPLVERPSPSQPPNPDGIAGVNLVDDAGTGIEERILFLANTTGEFPAFLDNGTVGILFDELKDPAAGQANLTALGFLAPFFMSGRNGGPEPEGTGGFTYAAGNSDVFEHFQNQLAPTCR